VDRRPTLLLCSLMLGCTVGDDVAARVSAVAIPGPWVPSAATRAAATQQITVVDPPAVAPLGRCTSSNPFACSCTHPACTPAYPGTRELNTFLLRRYPFLRAGGTYCCRQNSSATSVPRLSVHATGRAIDLMVPMVGGDADNTLGDAVANWLVENASYIGLQRVIWDRAYWNGERGFGLLTSASLPHTDHLHIELSLAGAARTTAFFTSGASTGMSCTPRCDGPRLIRADCTTTDCAAADAPCLAGPPPRCGDPRPAEAPGAIAVAGATLPTVRPTAAPARFTFVSPTRLFDTRTPEGSARLTRSGAAGPLTPTSNGTLRNWSGVGLPAGTTGVWLNLAAVGVGAPGFITVTAAGQPRPPTSALNYLADAANANAAPAVFGDGSGVTFDTNASAHLIADLYGALSPTGAGLAPTGPTRALDTRADVALAANGVRAIDVSAPAGAAGVVATVTVIADAAPGFLSAFPCGTPPPPTSHINFAAGAVVANTIVSSLGGGQLCLRANVATHAVVDVTGFLTPSSGLTYTALAPQRVLDTREATSLFTGRLAARQVLQLPIQRLPGMPANAVAVVANLTAVAASSGGFVTAFPCGATVPGTSSLNFPAEAAVGALTVSTLGAGSLCVFANTRTHLIVDVLGVWTGSVVPPIMPPDPVDDGDDIPPEGPDASAPDVVTPPPDAVTPPADGSPTPSDGSTPDADDASTTDDASAADVDPPSDTTLHGGCACHAAPPPRAPSPLALLAALVSLLRRRSQARPRPIRA
jgi:MYXO-CTERM domain-containing protein